MTRELIGSAIDEFEKNTAFTATVTYDDIYSPVIFRVINSDGVIMADMQSELVTLYNKYTELADLKQIVDFFNNIDEILENYS